MRNALAPCIGLIQSILLLSVSTATKAELAPTSCLEGTRAPRQVGRSCHARLEVERRPFVVGGTDRDAFFQLTGVQAKQLISRRLVRCSNRVTCQLVCCSDGFIGVSGMCLAGAAAVLAATAALTLRNREDHPVPDVSQKQKPPARAGARPAVSEFKGRPTSATGYLCYSASVSSAVPSVRPPA